MPSEPIAVIGTGCRFPGGSNSPSKLWELLENPRDVLSKIPPGRRFDPEAFRHHDPEHHGTTDVSACYFLDEDPAEFDGAFFGVQPAESDAIDPQQRILMEVVYDSLCAAGQTIQGLRGSSTAIVVGIMTDDWGSMLYRDWEALPQYAATGISRAILSNRLSYVFDWHGPSITLDTACSSSLVAVHLAIQSLRSGESRTAVAAGANLILNPGMFVAESNLHMLSATGRSRMWDKDADGYARGEGIAAVVLKTLSAAIADGDHIECIIRETGVNQDGKTPGLTMPSATAQARLIRDTYARAGLDIDKQEDRPQFFHAHGTGTPAGDPQEAEAISKAFSGDSRGQKLYVGSVKTIVGHTEGTAGLASLISSSLALQNRTIPPNMHFNQLNPKLEPFYKHLEVPTSALPWPELLPGQPRRVSVNSFGFGGTNAHAIIEAYEPLHQASPSRPLLAPLTMSAANEQSLRTLIKSYSTYLRANSATVLQDFAYTLNERRSTLAYRAAVVASTSAEAADKMDALLLDSEDLGKRHFEIQSPRALAIFTGQGAQWPRMGADLLKASPLASRRLDELDKALTLLPEADRPDWTLREQLLADEASSKVGEAAVSQPLCTAVQIILVDLLHLADVKLQAAVGHSSGEMAAAYAAGLLSATKAISIAYYRGKYAKLAKSPNGTTPGAMMAAGTTFEDATELCGMSAFKGRLQVAARNSSSSVTLSGDEDAIDEAVEVFKDEKRFARRLRVDTAYHSDHMLPCSAPYLESMAGLADGETLENTSRPVWYSSVHGGREMSAGDVTAQYWADNMTNPVLFAPAVTAATKAGGEFDLCIEIGPHAALKGPCLDTLQELYGDKVPYTSVLSRGKPDVAEFASGLGFIWSNLGAGSVSLGAFDNLASGAAATERQLLPDLPLYPFDHSRAFWRLSRISGAHSISHDPPHPILGRRCVDRETAQEVQWRNILSPREVSWLKGHKINGQIVFPAAGFVSMAVEAIMLVAGKSSVAAQVQLSNLVIGRAMAFDDEDSSMESLFSLKAISFDKEKTITASFSCYSGAPHAIETQPVLNAQGEVTLSLAEPEAGCLFFAEADDVNMLELGVDRFYSELGKLRYEYSPPFRGMLSIKRKNGYATGVLEDQSIGSGGGDKGPWEVPWEDRLLIHPGMLDTAIQSALAAFSCPGDGRMWGLYVPVGADSITINLHFTERGTGGKQKKHPWEAVVRDYQRGRSAVDISILSEDGASTFVQLENMGLMPFMPARPEDDTVLFSRFEFKIDRPDGDMAARGDGFEGSDVQSAIDAERVSFYYLRRLLEQVTPEQERDTLPHYKHLLTWARHVVGLVTRGSNGYVPAAWQTDTEDQIEALLDKSRDRSDVRLIESVGKNIYQVVCKGSGILEYMAEDGLFDFYDSGLGLDIANRHLARMVAQVAHRYPRMKILEIGAGTGGSTRNILPFLGTDFSSYTYTDISSGFFEAAQDRFKDFAGRMVFKTFDMEQDPASQGFVEGSYDIVLASNVLHATDKLDLMMGHVRRLLKPGGWLMNLELNSNDNLRVGLPMGTLPGWWVGVGNGRDHGPALTLPQWDRLLRKAGFSGVETNTPDLHKLYVSTVFAAQAVDDRVALLRSPLLSLSTLPPTEAAQLVMVGGEALVTHRLAETVATILSPRFASVTRVVSLSDLKADHLPPSSIVLVLSELDEALFKDMTPRKFGALKTLWNNGSTILWLTKGARDENCHSFMTVGLARVLRFEHPHLALQVVDLDKADGSSAHIISEELVRLELLGRWNRETSDQEMLWSAEPELYVEDGARWIPRLYQCKDANNRFNSVRRNVTEVIDPRKSLVAFANNGVTYELQTPSPLHIQDSMPSASETVTVSVRHFLLHTVQVMSFGQLMVCVGVNEETGEQLIALSHAMESRVTVPRDWAVSLAGRDPVEALTVISAHLVAASILRLAPEGGVVIIHEPQESVGQALLQLSRKPSVKVTITTSRKDNVNKDWVYLHASHPKRLVAKLLPAAASLFVNLSRAAENADAASLVRTCLPPTCCIYGPEMIYGKKPTMRVGGLPEEAAQALVAAHHHCACNATLLDHLPVVSLQQVSALSVTDTPLTVVDCDETSVSVSVQAVDSGIIFKGDKTYFMVGLTGDVGQSLCKWMVQRGARYIVLTSRNPNIDPRFIAEMEQAGATILVLSLDITSKESLQQGYERILEQMPPIAGVANGAMVLQDSLFDNFSFENFNKVLAPKVIGTQLLDQLFYDTPLDFFIVFSSITGIIGNSGQSPYIAANMFMTALASRRRKRGVAGSAIAIASLLGIGYVERSEDLTGDYFERVGTKNISEQDLHQLFAEGILIGHPSCPENAEIITGLQPLYQDSTAKAQFWDDVKFNHFIMERSDDGNYVGKLGAVPVRVQLAAASKSEVTTIIKDAFIVRLKRTLMMTEEEELSDKVSLVEQGVDSLMAVDVRSWFLKELEVDIPVLKILGGSSISDVVAEAIEQVPASVVDLDALPESATQTEPAQPKKEVDDAPASWEPRQGSGSSSDKASTPPSNDSRSFNTPAYSETPLETPLPEQNKDIIKGSSNDTDTSAATFSPPHDAVASNEVATPMSYGQSRFWFLNDYLEDKTSFNMTVMFKLTGKMNVERLDRAVQTIAKRHEALRTRFFWSGEQDKRIATQGVSPEPHFRLVHKQLNSEADAKEELKKLHSHTWDLNSWEAAKVFLLSVGDNIHFLLVGGHHISWDGYGFTVLFVDLEAAYSGRPLPRLGPESQYPAFSKWQTDMYESGRMVKEIDSWRSVIPPDSPPIPLFPFARSQTRPMLDHFSQFEAKAVLPESTVSKLKILARKHRATMFHVYLAALKGLVFSLLPDIDDCFLGIADANRLDKKFMGSLGFFLNLLPIPFARGQERTKISDLVQDARDKAFATLDRSIVPWNVILKELQIPRTNTCAPIFQLFVDYRQIVQDRSIWGGCKLSDEDWLNARNGYDLTLGITDNIHESLLSLRLQANIYDEPSTHLLLRSYVNVLETFAAGLDINATELPKWAPVDIESAIQAGIGPSMVLEWPETISHRVDDMIAANGSKSAMKDGLGNELTYTQMGNRIDLIARALVAAGAVSGLAVGVFQDPSTDCICSMLAVLKIGATYVPLDRRNSMARLVSVVQQVKPKIVLSDSNTTSEYSLLGAVDCTEIVVSNIRSATTEAPLPIKAKADSPAIVLFTSGTTGKPKGIILTHSNLRAQTESYSRFCDIPAKAAVVLQQTIHSFDVSLDQIFAALTEGGCLVIVPASKRGDPQEVTKMMIEHGVTYTVATPSEYEMWFRYARENLLQCQDWRAAFGGGEHMHDGLVKEFARLGLPGLGLFNNYGPTEATMAITKGEIQYKDPNVEAHVPAGFILPNYKVIVVDQRMKPVPLGVPGEIVVGGPGIASGYLGLEEMTSEKFIPGNTIHPSRSSDNWYRTGDRGRLRADGALYVDGRIWGDSQVKIRGFRIEVAEVEAVLLKAAKGALSHAVVTARGVGEDRFLAAHIMFTPEYPQSGRRELLARLESKLPLPSYMQPAVVIPLEHMAVTKNFKLDREAIQALPLPTTVSESTEAEAGASIEETLVNLWKSVIPHDIGVLTPESDFFDLGGNSIQLVKLQAAIRRELKCMPKLVDMMNKSTVGGMVDIIDGSLQSQVIDWEAETDIPQRLAKAINQAVPTNSIAQKRRGDRVSVILVGAAGYVGRHLLRKLIILSQVSEVCCLVRPGSEQAIASELAASPKVKLVQLDLSEPGLGLSPTEFADVAKRADVVVNCAANRSFWDSYDALRPVNVDAVKDLVGLCVAHSGPSAFHMLSSGSVDKYIDGSQPPTDGSDGYVASKWASESFLQKVVNAPAVKAKQLQVHLHRPLAAPGRSNSDLLPASAANDAAMTEAIVKDLVGLVRTLGKRPDFTVVAGHVDLVPVDTVVKDIVASILPTADDDKGESVHVVSHHAQLRVQIKDFMDGINGSEELKALPAMNPLHWFRDAKLGGFRYLITSQKLIMSSEEGDIEVSR